MPNQYRMVIYLSVIGMDDPAMDIREVRRRNLKALMDREFAGVRGAQSRLAEKLDKPQNFISRCLADPGKAGAKTIGEDFAREIEIAFGLDRYALDSEDMAAPSGINSKESNVVAADFSRRRADMVDIPRLDVAGSMGLGIARPDRSEERRVGNGWGRRAE